MQKIPLDWIKDDEMVTFYYQDDECVGKINKLFEMSGKVPIVHVYNAKYGERIYPFAGTYNLPYVLRFKVEDGFMVIHHDDIIFDTMLKIRVGDVIYNSRGCEYYVYAVEGNHMFIGLKEEYSDNIGSIDLLRVDMIKITEMGRFGYRRMNPKKQAVQKIVEVSLEEVAAWKGVDKKHLFIKE